jgi:WhiB family transcriptional regulator, redox-sensing transcriptional regulator
MTRRPEAPPSTERQVTPTNEETSTDVRGRARNRTLISRSTPVSILASSLALSAADDSWRDHALCRDTDPDLFFPVGTTGLALVQIEQAKRVCRQCPVTETCLDYALATNQDSGVWGGLSEEERRVIRRRRAAAARAAG